MQCTVAVECKEDGKWREISGGKETDVNAVECRGCTQTPIQSVPCEDCVVSSARDMNVQHFEAYIVFHSESLPEEKIPSNVHFMKRYRTTIIFVGVIKCEKTFFNAK